MAGGRGRWRPRLVKARYTLLQQSAGDPPGFARAFAGSALPQSRWTSRVESRTPMLTRLRGAFPLEEAVAATRFVRALLPFLRHPVSHAEALARVRMQLEQRAQDFLLLAATALAARPAPQDQPGRRYTATLRGAEARSSERWSAMPSRWTPSRNRSGGTFEKFKRIVFWPVPSA